MKKLIPVLLITILTLPYSGEGMIGVRPARAQLVEQLPTAVEIVRACGDGFTEIGFEVCDPGQPGIPADVGTMTCDMYDDIYGNPFTSGSMSCLPDCSDYDTSRCFTCGNGYKEGPEQCDGGDFGSQRCETFGLKSGSLLCSGTCLITLNNCLSQNAPSSGSPSSGQPGGAIGSNEGFKPGSDKEVVTRVIMSGKSYPNSEVHVLLDGAVIGIAQADSKADFYFESDQVTPGVVSFSFWSEDKDGTRSTLLTLTLRVVSGAVTTISGIYLSPSIKVNKKAVEKGEPITIYGQTAPEATVNIHVNSEEEFVESTESAKTGDWKIMFETEKLAEEYHTAKALFQLELGGNVVKSGFSNSVSFYVGAGVAEGECAGADLNKDGRVNLTDFSILLYWWGTDNPCADQDNDGKVNLVDFSIMMYHWTG